MQWDSIADKNSVSTRRTARGRLLASGSGRHRRRAGGTGGAASGRRRPSDRGVAGAAGWNG